MLMLLPLAALLLLLGASAPSTQEALPTDLAGHAVRLFHSPNSKTTVLIFVRTDCPITNRYAPALQRLAARYSSKAAMYLVYADASETPENIRKHLKDYRFGLPPLRDSTHALVKLAKARVTPEAAVFSPQGRLLYHGRIDDRYTDLGKAAAAPTTHELADAIEAALAGRPIPVESTRAVGCFLADVQ